MLLEINKAVDDAGGQLSTADSMDLKQDIEICSKREKKNAHHLMKVKEKTGSEGDLKDPKQETFWKG